MSFEWKRSQHDKTLLNLLTRKTKLFQMPIILEYSFSFYVIFPVVFLHKRQRWIHTLFWCQNLVHEPFSFLICRTIDSLTFLDRNLTTCKSLIWSKFLQFFLLSCIFWLLFQIVCGYKIYFWSAKPEYERSFNKHKP